MAVITLPALGAGDERAEEEGGLIRREPEEGAGRLEGRTAEEGSGDGAEVQILF